MIETRVVACLADGSANGLIRLGCDRFGSRCKPYCNRAQGMARTIAKHQLAALASATLGGGVGCRGTLSAMAVLTIREAAETTGHSTHKIRRLIKAIGDDAGHSDRSLVEPSPADVERLNGEGVQFTWRIEEELVRRRLGDAPAATSSRTEEGRGESGNVLALLERAMHAKEEAEAKLFEQLKTKDNQIAGLQQTVTSLNERLRESNVLMASLQRQLPEGKERAVGVANEGRKAAAKRQAINQGRLRAAEAPASMAREASFHGARPALVSLEKKRASDKPDQRNVPS